MKKFKVGDKVKLNRLNECTYGFEENETVEIVGFDDENWCPVVIKKIDSFIRGYVSEDMLTPLVTTRENLQEGDRLTLRNGKVGIYSETMDIDDFLYKNINDDLTNNGFRGDELDIVKVERPFSYETVYERTEEKPKKMTVAEVCEELGYDVEIVKE